MIYKFFNIYVLIYAKLLIFIIYFKVEFYHIYSHVYYNKLIILNKY